MHLTPSPRLSIAAFGLALLCALPSAQAAVGARVMLQEWSPLTPKQQPLRVLVNDPRVVSDQLQKAWTSARPLVCQGLVAAMAKAVASRGQQLRDVKCQLDETVAFSVANAGANALSASFAIGGYVEATTTTPTPIGSYGDPRFSLRVTANLLAALAVQPNPNQTLRANTARFSLSDASIDSHNAVGDAILFVAEDLLPFFKGANFRKLAEDAINQYHVNFEGSINSALAPVNELLRTPSGAVRIAVWGRPDSIIVAFGPRELTPPSGGTVFGALRWDKNQVTAPNGCSSFSISASVQTGPAPLRDPSGYFEPADAPMRQIGNFQLQPGTAEGECRYRMTALATGWPNELKARSSIGAKKSTGNSLYRVNYALSGDGWDGHTVVPQPSAERNYRVHGSANATATLDQGLAAKKRVLQPGGPVINPGITPSKAAIAPATGATAVLNKGKAVSLNPQPLPPSTLTPAQVPSALR